MFFASVILDIPTAALDAPYTYAVPETADERALFVKGAKRSKAKPAQKPKAPAQPTLEDFLAAEAASSALEDPNEGAFAAAAPALIAESVVAATSEEAVNGTAACASSLAAPGASSQAAAAFGAEKPAVAGEAVLASGLGAGVVSAPDPVASQLQVGCPVLVPFGGRKAVGFVGAISREAPASIDMSKIRAVEEVLGKPCFTQIGAKCAQFLANRYLAPFSSCIRLFMPPGGVPRMERINGTWQVTRPMVAQVDERWVSLAPGTEGFKPRKGAVKQELVLQALQQGDLRVSELTAEYGSVSPTLKSLEKKGVIKIERRRRMRSPEEASAAFQTRVHERPVLTESQQGALAAYERAAQHNDGHVVLVDGVTGSGKTEVYLRAIEQALQQGRGAIVLVPEISLTPQTVARFRGRFGNTVAVLHSRMSQGERFDQWDLIREGQARVVVGARSALFCPMKNVGVIIIDEEHEGSYKQDQAPRYVTRDVAEWMARAHGGVLMLGSATPSLEALQQCRINERWERAEMPKRANGKPMPQVKVVDMAREFGGGNRSMFSRELKRALMETLEKGEKAVLMLNQRGFAQFLLCRDCGFVPECDSCSTSLTYHEREAKLVCHHCGSHRSVPAVCPECGSPYLKRFGAGTQRVEAELNALLAGVECTVVRMDADTTARKGSHQRLLETFAAPGAAVLLGTQMIAKGLDFDEVTLVGVINADTMLKLPDFRSSERTFDLIQQVAGRAGRASKPGYVVVQTYSAQSVAIRAAASYNRERFLAEELELRQGLGYPPFVRMANVLVWGKNEDRVREVAANLFQDLSELAVQGQGQPWVLFPPTPCVLERLKGQWRYHILVKVPPEADIAQRFGAYFRARAVERDVRVSIDIDPVSLL